MGNTKYLQGYETDDFQSPLLDERILKIRENNLKRIRLYPQQKHMSGIRKTMATTLPWYVFGACELKPNDNDIASMIDGSKHRVGGVTPSPCPRMMKRFALFVKLWIRANLKPLEIETDVSVETWLKESPYTLDRQDELREAYYAFISDVSGESPKYHKLESFIKDEFYQCPKTFRTINSRIDIYKCLVGPYIHAMEKEIFKLPYFIKKIPVDQRSAYIHEHMDGFNKYNYTIDFTAFEASFSKMFMKACEIQVVKYMSSQLEEGAEFVALYEKLLLSNKLCFSGFLCEILARRMSGEMSTSVFNGLSNLLIILFIATLVAAIIKVIVEGDDSIITSDKPLDESIFGLLGFIAKIVILSSIRIAAFCGLVFSAVGHTIREPIHVLMKLGWATQQYNRASERLKLHLLRAKALSLKCEMPNCPILGPLADRLIHLTSHLKTSKTITTYVKHLSLYDREKYLAMVSGDTRRWSQKSEVLDESRELMNELYGIDVQTQLTIESKFEVMGLGPHNDAVILECVPNDNKLFWDTYVSESITQICDSIMYKKRVDYYATHLPCNALSDERFKKQHYSVMVA